MGTCLKHETKTERKHEIAPYSLCDTEREWLNLHFWGTVSYSSSTVYVELIQNKQQHVFLSSKGTFHQLCRSLMCFFDNNGTLWHTIITVDTCCLLIWAFSCDLLIVIKILNITSHTLYTKRTPLLTALHSPICHMHWFVYFTLLLLFCPTTSPTSVYDFRLLWLPLMFLEILWMAMLLIQL